MTPEQQEAFAAHLREYMTPDPVAYLLSFKEFSSQVLGREVGKWRELSVKDAQRVMSAAKRLQKPMPRAA